MNTHQLAPGGDCVSAQFPDAVQAQGAVRQLRDAGLPGESISLLTPGDDGRVAEPLPREDAMEKSATFGAGAGAALGFAAGATLLAMPFGAVVAAGAAAAALTGGLVGGLVAAMAAWGVDEDQARKIEAQLLEGRSVVIVRGDPTLLARAQEILQTNDKASAKRHAESADSPVDP